MKAKSKAVSVAMVAMPVLLSRTMPSWERAFLRNSLRLHSRSLFFLVSFLHPDS